GLRRCRNSRPARRRSLPCGARRTSRSSTAKSHCRSCAQWKGTLDRAYRVHWRRWRRSFLLGERGDVVLESCFGRGEAIWNRTVRTRRARHVAPGNVLSAQRLRPVAGAKSNRGRSRVLRRSNETEFHWSRSFAQNEGEWASGKTCCVPNAGQRSAATAALFYFRQRRARRRSDERHSFAELELRNRNGVCLGVTCEDWIEYRDRNPRPEISSYDREKTALQKIMNVPDDLLYTETHEWIKRESDNVRVGITDHAQAELTDVVYVELPKMDRQLNARESIAVVESVKAASDIYTPVKGTVVEVNKALEADPGLINREPYGQGWIFVLKIDNADDLKQLKDATAYRKQIG